ncbi:MAG: integrase [Clostridium sp.]|jgi:integrase
MARKINCTKNGIDYFRVTASIGRTSEGKLIRKEFYGESKKDAIAKKDEYLNGLKNGLNVDFKNILLGDLIHSWLFETIRISNKIKPSTFERYEGIYRNYIKNSVLYGLKLNELKSIQIQRYYNKLLKDGKSSNVINNLNKLIKYFLNYAVDEGYLIKNPCNGKKIVIPGESVKESEVRIFDDTEINLFKVVLESHRLKALFLLDLATGLRQGELLGLKWSDIDMINKELHVNRSLKQVSIISADGTRKYKTIEQIPKTKGSIRTVPIPDNLINILKTHSSVQKQEKLKAGSSYKISDFIFTTEVGTTIDARNITKQYERLLTRVKIDYRKFHSMRHTYATKLFERGVKLKTVSELLGHSNIAITADIYTHVMPKEKNDAADKINDLFD